MENEIGVARVGVEVDSSRAEGGLTRIEAAVTRTGRTIRNFGAQGADALDGVGAGGAGAATRLDGAARSIVASIERTTAALNAGKKGTAEYFEEMARLRGVSLDSITPSLTGLREAEAAQVRLAAAAEQVRAAQERAAASAREEAQAQREAAQAGASREQFIAGLREQVALYGQSQEAVLRYRAAQIGAAEAAEPLIRQLREQREAQEQVTSAAMATAQAQREMALAQNTRDTFVADLERQADAIGRTRAELLELRAAQLGVTDQAAPFIQRLREQEAGLGNVGNTARQTANAMRGVPAQFTDIVVSLQGGQAPLTVLLQQGGQLVDMFGGLQEAGQAMGQQLMRLVNPYTAVAAAIAITGAAYYNATEETDAYVLALAKSGNTAGLTSSKLTTMAESISKATGTQSAAAESLVAMVGAGNIAAGDMERFAKVAMESQKHLGLAVEDTAKAFSELGKDPLAASQKLDSQLNYLTLSVSRQIKALQEQGEFEKAAALAQSSYADALDERNRRIAASMGALETSWGWAVTQMKKGWDSFVGVFREDTLEEKIEGARKALARAQAARYTFVGSGADGAAALDRRKKALQELLDVQERGNRLDEAKAKQQALKEAGARWDDVLDKYKSPTDKLDEEVTRITNLGKAAGATQKQIDSAVAAAREAAAGGKANEAVELQIAALQRRGAVEEEIAKRSRLLLESKHASGIVAEEQYIQALETLDISASEREKRRLQDELRLTTGKKDSQREQIDLRGRIALLDESIATRRLETEAQLTALEDERDRVAAKNTADTIDRAAGVRDSITGQLTAQLDYNATIGKTAQELAGITSARLLDSAATAEQNSAIQATIVGGEQLSDIYRQQAEDLRALAGAKLEGAELQKVASGLKELDDFLDPTKPQEFGDALRDAFGGAGSAIVQMTGALNTFGQKQAEIEKHRASAADALKKGELTGVQYAEKIAGLNKKDTDSRLRGYGDMTAAAAGFFGEQSRGYKALQTASQVFHAAELAATLAELVPKGISAVLNQGNGDPYTAFGRMASMAAIVAGLGVAIGGIGGSGGGGGMSAADMQKQQGTGSDFGDSTAQSDSIAASLEMLEQNSGSLIPINKGMLEALRAIEASMTGLTNLVVRVPGLIEGENLGIAAGTALNGSGAVGNVVTHLNRALFDWANIGIGDAITAALFGKTKQTIVDSGLQFGGAVRDLQAGSGFEQYASVDTTKSSFFGLSKKTSNRVETAGLSDELADQFGKVFTNVEKALEAAAIGMGVGADHVTKVLDSLSIEMTKVSLKGLTGEDLTAAISAVISKATDDMASAVFPELESFRQVGEGYAETVIRLASNYGLVDAALTSLGMQFGTVGLGSLTARERLIELAGGIDALTEQASSFADNFLTEAERLAPVQKYVAEQMAAMGLASITTKDQFKALVLGLNVSTEAGAKQYAALMGLSEAFAAVADAAGKAAEESAEKAKEIAEQRGDLEIQLMQAQGNAAGVLAAQRKLELAALDESNRPLKERIYALQDEKTALEAMKTAAAALVSNVDSAFGVLQQVVGRQRTVLQDAYDAQAKALDLQISTQTDAVTKLKSLADSLKSTLNGLEVPGQEAFGRQQAQAEIRAALAIARAGGPLPDADKLQKALSTIGQDASDQFGSYTDYMRDFYATARDVAGLGGLADSSLSVAEQTLIILEDQKTAAEEAHKKELKALEQLVEDAQEQIAALKGIDSSVLTLSQAITGLASAIATAQANPIVGATTAINQAYQQSLGRAPDKAGLEYWQQQAANGSSAGNIADAIKNSAEAQLRGMYESLLGREVDGAGLSYYMGLVKSGASLDNIQQDLMNSPEYLKKLRGFAVGTNYVPQTMPALIHEGERIIPAADNRALMAALTQRGQPDQALIERVEALQVQVEKLLEPLQRAASGATGTRELLYNVSAGGNAFAVEVFNQ